MKNKTQIDFENALTLNLKNKSPFKFANTRPLETKNKYARVK